MAITIDGNSLIFTGTLTVTNFTNPANGLCTLILTPSGGVGTLPALLAGTPGLSPTLAVGTVTTLSAGSAATVTMNQTNAGGPGVASAYNVNFGIPQGAAGTNSTTIANATDLTGGTAVVGDIITVSAVSPSKTFSYTAFPFANVYNATTFNNVSQAGVQSNVQLCAVSIPAQTFSYIPICWGSATSVGTANTIINLAATLGSGGAQLGVEQGLTGVATQRLHLLPAFTALMGGGVNVVAHGVTQAIYFVVNQTANVSDSWSLSNTTMSFTVGLLPAAF